jgi:hypothetical protein
MTNQQKFTNFKFKKNPESYHLANTLNFNDVVDDGA